MPLVPRVTVPAATVKLPRTDTGACVETVAPNSDKLPLVATCAPADTLLRVLAFTVKFCAATFEVAAKVTLAAVTEEEPEPVLSSPAMFASPVVVMLTTSVAVAVVLEDPINAVAPNVKLAASMSTVLPTKSDAATVVAPAATRNRPPAVTTLSRPVVALSVTVAAVSVTLPFTVPVPASARTVVLSNTKSPAAVTETVPPVFVTVVVLPEVTLTLVFAAVNTALDKVTSFEALVDSKVMVLAFKLVGVLPEPTTKSPLAWMVMASPKAAMLPNTFTPAPASVAIRLMVLAYIPPNADESMAKVGAALPKAPVVLVVMVPMVLVVSKMA